MMAYAEQLQALHEAMVGQRPDVLLPLVKSARHESLPVRERIAIYVDGYVERLADATMADYPALAHYLGKEECRRAAEAFVRATPSVYWDLNRYPVAFTAFLEGYMADGEAHALARLEGAIADVFWLPESEPLQAQSLACFSEEAFGRCRFRFRAALRLLKLDYAAHEYLTAFRVGSPLPALERRTERLLVIRHDNEVKRLVLEPDECLLLERLQDGDDVNGALAAAAGSEGLAERLPQYVARWFTLGVFTDVLGDG